MQSQYLRIQIGKICKDYIWFHLAQRPRHTHTHLNDMHVEYKCLENILHFIRLNKHSTHAHRLFKTLLFFHRFWW